MTVAEQVISIFAGVNGFLDDTELGNIKKFEINLLDEINNNNSDIIDEINSTGKLEENTKNKLISVIEKIKKGKNI